MKLNLLNRLKHSSIFKDSFWALVGNALGKGLALIAGIAVARFLGKEAYGEYGMIRNNLYMIAIFSTLGLGYTATKFIAECRADKIQTYIIHKIVTRVTLVMSCSIMIIVIIFAYPFAEWLNAPKLGGLLRISAIAIIFNAINTTQIGELSGLNAYREIAKNNTLAGIITFFTSIILTYLYDVTGAVIALILSFAANCLLNKISIQKKIQKFQSNIISKDRYFRIIWFSIPVALQESFYAITSWVTTIILIKLSGYGELGIYSAATQWMVVMLFVPGALRNVALSHLSETNNSISANKNILRKMSLINFFTTFIPFIIIFILSSWICSLYGDSYHGLQAVLNILIFSSIINALLNALTQNLIALGENWFLFASRFFKDAITIILCIVMIQYGCGGALSFALSSLILSMIYLAVLFFKQLFIYNKWNERYKS